MRLLTTKRFEKDLKRGRKPGKDLDKLWSVVERLLSNQQHAGATSPPCSIPKPLSPA